MRCRTFHDAIARARSQRPSSDRAFRLALADAYLGSSNAKRDLGDDRGAFEAASECLRLYREAADADRSNQERDDEAWPARCGAVGMAQSRLGQLEPALDSFREGAATLETLVAAEPRNVNLGTAS